MRPTGDGVFFIEACVHTDHPPHTLSPRDGLRTELKLLREDLHRITLELKERMMKVEKLQAKYETISSKHRGTEEDGDQRSQAYYVIKAAQEREELQRQGDNLDAKIRRAEKEVQALETTLLQLVSANGNFTQTFKKVDSKSSVEERAALRDKLDRAYDKLKFKRSEESVVSSDLQQLEARLGSMSVEHRSATSASEDYARRRTEALRAVKEQEEKFDRAQKQVSKIQARLGQSPLVLESELFEAKEVCRAMLAELGALAGGAPGLAARAETYGINLPKTGPGGALTPQGGSRASSVSGSRPGSAIRR